MPPPFELPKKISRMAKNATKMRHFQAKIAKIAPPLSEILNTPLFNVNIVYSSRCQIGSMMNEF